MTGIYKIINRTNGKYYVGSTKNSNVRWSDHKEDLNKHRHYNIHLQRAWMKYGESNFEFVMIEECQQDQLLITEQRYLDTCKNNPSESYNQIYSAGGGGCFSEEILQKLRRPHPTIQGKNHPGYGKPLSDETKLKISCKNKEYYSNPSNRTMLGKHHSEESKQKISTSRIGKYGGENCPTFGKHLSDETKRKIRESHVGKVLSEEHKNKISKSLTGHIGWNTGMFHSDETKQKISNALKGKQTGEENGMYGKHHSLESRQKMSIQRTGENNARFDPLPITLKNISSGEIITNTKHYFVKEKHLFHSSICKLLRGEAKTHRGWMAINISSAPENPQPAPVI